MRNIAYSMYTVLTDLASFSSNFNVISDIEDTNTVQDTKLIDDTSINRTAKQNEIVSSSCEIRKGNASNEIIKNMKESRVII